MTRLDELFRFSQTALKVHAHRQQLIASNIANADTPGYKARDIDFASVLKNAQGAQTKPQLQPVGTTGLDATPFGAELLYRSVVQRSVDGNTVDLDIERAQFAENAVRYEAQLTFVSSQVKAMLAAIQG
ncbi:MAG TPA: flagellar basal body rod protein FlgB [Burkholderiales bacterium]|nr:flagellar basal body rod protein FlgB [Burkholderiales bacterium]